MIVKRDIGSEKNQRKCVNHKKIGVMYGFLKMLFSQVNLSIII